MIPNRSPAIWSLRGDFRDYVQTLPDDGIVVFVNGSTVHMTRRTARLLAKRINQCLDATVKK